jgi:hypothetical protein
MALQVFDLSSTITSDDENNSNSSTISGTKVPDNITYTQITVKNTRHNDTKSSTITSAGTTVPVEDTSGGNKFSAVSRLTSSIALPLPRNIPFSWSNDWSQQETGFLEQAIARVNNGDISSVADAGRSFGDAAKNKLIDIAPTLGLRKLMQKNVGAVSNPFKEIYYNGVSFRTFTFSWEFAPRNSTESKTLENLIYYLELSSHPELSGGDLSSYFIPDSFELQFVGTRIPKLQTLVLTNMNVDYAPYGPKILKDQNMAFTNLDLTFLELYPLTKEDIRKSRSGIIADLFTYGS